MTEPYDPTHRAAEGELLMKGEHRFRITSAVSYVADSGRTVWKFRCETEQGGRTVPRYHRITLGTSMTQQNIQELVDACGKDPNDPQMAEFIAERIEPENFEGKEFAAMVEHYTWEGKLRDRIRYPIPGFYRERWDAARGAQQQQQEQQQEQQPAADDIPF